MDGKNRLLSTPLDTTQVRRLPMTSFEVMADSPITFPEKGALPACYPPDRPHGGNQATEEGVLYLPLTPTFFSSDRTDPVGDASWAVPFTT